MQAQIIAFMKLHADTIDKGMRNDLYELMYIFVNTSNSMTKFTILWGSFLGVVSSFISGIWLFLLVTMWLVVADLIVGIAASMSRKEKISSFGISRTIGKFIVYTCAILSARGIEQVFAPAFINDAFYITYMVSGTICLREFKSILENVETVTGTDLMSILDKLTKIIHKDK